MMYPKLRQTELIISLNDIRNNVDTIKEKLSESTKIMLVIKANAYGLGMDKMIDIAQEKNIDIVRGSNSR